MYSDTFDRFCSLLKLSALNPGKPNTSMGLSPWNQITVKGKGKKWKRLPSLFNKKTTKMWNLQKEKMFFIKEIRHNYDECYLFGLDEIPICLWQKGNLRFLFLRFFHPFSVGRFSTKTMKSWVEEGREWGGKYLAEWRSTADWLLRLI